jgi:hypothetical protein
MCTLKGVGKPSEVLSELEALQKEPRKLPKLLIAVLVLGVGSLLWVFVSTYTQERAKHMAAESATTGGQYNASQISSAPNSPNVANVKGNVTIDR